MFSRFSRFVLIAALVLSAAPFALGQNKTPDRRPPDGNDGDTSPILYKMFPDYDVFALSYEDYETRRLDDLVEVNVVLYDLTKEERSRVQSMLQKLEGEPTKKGELDDDDGKFAAMINERAEITRSLQGKFDVDKSGTKETQQLLTSSGLMKTQALIANIERGRNDAVNQIRPAVEAMIGPERTQAAYSQWQYRIDQAREHVALKSLLQTLRTPNEVREMIQRDRAAAHAGMPPAEKMKPVEPREKAVAALDKPKETPRRTPRRRKTESAKADSEPAKRSTEKKSRPAPTQAPKEKPIPLDKWEQYVRDFIADYKCTAEQSHSALSILSELKDRADVYEKTSKKRLDAANEIKDRKERQKRIDEINAPVDRLFEQLKRRLDGLLTTHQRAIKKATTGSSNRKKKSQ
ncbi:MAG: hypothetical protein H6818_21585 [Phycisphaerales bacterium]|nr:hypothetical protein [Phycisphaerales bacterium]MCB9862383.1 hypothetical protein [Phycisphaerales bacterium]